MTGMKAAELDALAKRVGAGPSATARRARGAGQWSPLELADLGTGQVLAFDQSLSATGWVWVSRLGLGVEVNMAGSFGGDAPEELRGHEEDLMKGESIFNHAGAVMDIVRPLVVVHETPPVGTTRGRPTASLLAAQAVRIAAYSRGIPRVMLGAQPAKKLLTGNGNADKKVAHEALARFAKQGQHGIPHIRGYDIVTNEAKRDALLLALLWLSRQQKEGVGG